MTKARAVVIRRPGDPSVLAIGEIDVRDPGPGEIAVDVAAAGLNRADLLQRRGLYPPPAGFPPDIPGLEFAGVVAAVGEGVATRRLGDRVMGIVGGAGMATRVVVHERESISVPDGLSLNEAAAIPEVFLTAFDALFGPARLARGEVALIHAVGGGVGTAALQLVLVAGAVAIGTSRSARKLGQAGALGLSYGLEVHAGAFAKQVRGLTGGAGVDVILDPVGAAYLAENVSVLATGGRLVAYGTLGGDSGNLPLGLLIARRACLFGTVLRARPPEEKANLAQRFADQVLPLFSGGAAVALRPVVHAILPMTSVADAHAQMERNETFGKIVLTWS